jgi:DNA-binding MarR family transcriptional regulator
MLDQWAQERPDLDPRAMGVVLRIQGLADALEERLRTILAPHQLAVFEYEVLSALRRSGPQGGCTAGELCLSAKLSSGAMTNRLDRLEDRGLVERWTSPQDRRSVTVRLTPAGLELVDRVLGERMADAEDCLGNVGRADRRALVGLLRALCLDLDAPVEPD